MPQLPLIYWIKFDENREPIKIIAHSWIELIEILNREVLFRHKQPIEWLIRDYK